MSRHSILLVVPIFVSAACANISQAPPRQAPLVLEADQRAEELSSIAALLTSVQLACRQRPESLEFVEHLRTQILDNPIVAPQYGVLTPQRPILSLEERCAQAKLYEKHFNQSMALHSENSYPTDIQLVLVELQRLKHDLDKEGEFEDRLALEWALRWARVDTRLAGFVQLRTGSLQIALQVDDLTPARNTVRSRATRRSSTPHPPRAELSPVPTAVEESPDQAIEREFHRLKRGRVSFTPPPTASRVGVRDTLHLWITKDTARALPRIKVSSRWLDTTELNRQATDLATRLVPVSTRMSANLTGSGYRIRRIFPTADGEGTQLVSDDDETKWEWEFQPRRSGRPELLLSVKAYVRAAGEQDMREFEVLRESIPVDVDRIASARIWWEDQPAAVQNALAGAGLFLTTVSALLALVKARPKGGRWRRRGL